MTRLTAIDAYLAGVPRKQRAALEKLRRQIRAAAPGAVETITYSLPGFRLDGRILVCFAARKDHCSFHPMSEKTLADHARDVAGFATSTGTLRFQPEQPPSAALVRKLVRARIAENQEAAELAAERARKRKAVRTAHAARRPGRVSGKSRAPK